MRTSDSGMIDHCHRGAAGQRCVLSCALPRPLRMYWGRVLVCLISFCWLSLVAIAAEPILPFIEGLRERGYYDVTLAYLDKLEQRSDVPADIKERIPYERAQTLLAGVRELNSVDAQRQQLDAAEAAFEQFVKAAPGNPLAATANTWRGRILFEKARVEIFEGDDPANQSKRKDYQAKARSLLQQARRLFEQAAAQNKKSLDEFPAFIPETEKEKHAARTKVENTYIEVVFEMGRCTYWEARTYDKGSKDAKAALQKASAEFTDMYERTRNNAGGKFARLWQGKCFEELDQITQALGVYEDLLTLTPDTPVKATLYDLSLRFKLICLNHEQKKDYPLVVTLAEEWLSIYKDRARSEAGYGIEWELCRALEKLGADSSKSENERSQALNKALNHARTLSRTSGEFKAPSQAMVQRLLRSLNRSADEPTDFESAYGMATKLAEDIEQLRQQVVTAQQDGQLAEAKSKQAALIESAGKMAKMCDYALRKAKPTTEPGDLHRASVLLAYGYLLEEKYLEAAAVGEFTMRSFAEKSPDNARNGGLLAMSAFNTAYKKAEKGHREFEARKLIEIATRMDKQFPDSDQANEARIAAAVVFWDERKLDSAAEWWDKVPAGTAHYAGAQLSAGQAYWGQYTTSLNLPEEKRPGKEQFTEWREQAVKHLEAGIAERMQTTPDDAPAPDDLVRGKITLAQIRNLDGIYHTEGSKTGAIELLTKGPHSVVEAIAVPEGTERPKSPGNPKSRAIASFAYQQLLKAQIGAKDLDAAREARIELENVAGSEDAEALTQVFVEFGQELEKELKQLKAAGNEDRAEEVRDGFETFLNDLFKREDGQSFTSLFWIAETFTSLAESSSDDRDRAQSLFASAAAAYQKIVEKAKADAAFAQPDQLLYSQMRLVNCKQLQGAFADGERLLHELLKDKKAAESPNVQFTAASLYQAWGGSSDPDAWKKYQIAVQGSKAPVVIWGWAYTAQRLQRVQMTKPDPRIAELELDARYNLGVCQLAYARKQSTPAERTKAVSLSRSGIETFARLSKSLPPEQFERFNSLYREIQTEAGVAPVDLVVGAGKVATPTKVKPADAGATPAPPVANQPAAEGVVPASQQSVPESKTDYVTIGLVSLAGVAAVAGILFMTRRRPRGRFASKRATSRTKTTTVSEYQPDLNLEALATPPRRSAAPAPKTEVKPTAPATPPSSPSAQIPPLTPPVQKPKPTRLPGRPSSGEP
ncbi:MAG: hypothetical protein U0929_04405 [Planctomycetaceae bacterium]